MKQDYVPLLERPQKKENYDEMLQKRRKTNPKRYKNELEGCTFRPEIGEKRRRNQRIDPNKSVDRLLEWGKIREGKVAKRRIANQNKQKVYSFQPNLSERSKKIASRISSKGIPIHERLIKKGKDKDKWIRSQRKIEKDALFKPYICKKSKKILERKSENLVKIDNGRTQTVAYYTAIPKETKDNKRVPARSKSRKNKKSQKPQKRKSQTPNRKLRFKKSRTPEKKKDKYPDYMSPFNPKVMTSNLPLDSILKKSKIHRENLKKRGKSKNKNQEMPIKSTKDPLKFYKSSNKKKPKRKNISNLPPRSISRARTKSRNRSIKKEFSTEVKAKNKRRNESTKKKRAKELIYSHKKNKNRTIEKTKSHLGDKKGKTEQRVVKSFKAQSVKSIAKSRKNSAVVEKTQVAV